MMRSAFVLVCAYCGIGALTACSAPQAQPPKPQFHAVSESAAPLAADRSDLAVLNRVSWGANTADAQALAATGLAA